MGNDFGKDLTSGSIPKRLISFSLPILIGNLMTTGYSIINAIWVGNMVGNSGAGAIAVSFPILLILVALSSGATLATSILTSQHYGAKNYAMIRKIADNSWGLAVIIVPIVTVTGLFLSEPLLRLMGTSQALLPMARSYLMITLAGFVFTYLSSLVISLLRGIGETVVPMVFLIISVAINAILDPLMIGGIGFPKLGLNGAALASLISTAAATVLGLIYMQRKFSEYPISFSKFEFDRKIMLDILKIGIPSFIQQSLVSISYAFVVSFVNAFGENATAAFGITSRLDSVIAMPAIAMMMAASTITAQNLGAGKADKIKDVFKWGVLINMTVIAVISALLIIFPNAVMHAFIQDPKTVSIGASYLRIVGFGYLMFGFSYVSNGIINGAGKTIITMIISFISVCVIRVPFAAILSHTPLHLNGIWITVALSYVIAGIVSLGYYFLGGWKKTELKKSEEATTEVS